ncbi:MAG: 6-phosphogluconolactonase [Methylibium sp. NZG]|nr:MAG: 6-phosphogluconolactonase [Methylibium sp. NZG]
MTQARRPMRTVVYVSNADSGDISVLRMDAHTGALTPLRSATVGGASGPLAVSPDRRFLYVARRSEPTAVLAFAIDGTSGELAPLGQAALPASMAYLSIDRSGRHVLSASYGGHQLAVSPVAANGVPVPARQVLPTEPNAHAVLADPSNRFVLATSLGGDLVMQQRFDATNGQLTPNTPAAVRVRKGAGPRHLVFHPSGRFVYLLNELDASIDVFAFDTEQGLLAPLQTITSLPAGMSGAPWAADIHVTPDGRFLYSSERRSSTLAAFRIDAASGLLALIGHVPTETQPRGFNIDPRGRFLLAVGQASHRLSRYAIDAASGALSKVDDCAVGQNPHWIEIIDLP